MLLGFLWRFIWALRPVASDYFGYWLICSPRRGFIGTHHPTHARCATCKRRNP